MLFNPIPMLPPWVDNIVLPLNRWIHIVCTTTLVGGTLFYEFVIPAGDRRPERRDAGGRSWAGCGGSSARS